MMLRRRPWPCLYRGLCTPAVSGTLLQSSSSRCQNKLQQNHLPPDAAIKLVNDSPAASLRIKSRLRANCIERTVQFVKSRPCLGIGQLPWWMYVPHSTVNPHQSSLNAVQYRQFSVSTAANNSGGVFESSSKARWAADASTTTTTVSDATTTVADINTTVAAADTATESTANSTDSVTQVLSELSAQGDFASLGLGGHSPVGLLQSSLEYLHVQAHMPWWLAIVACTVVLRVMIFPVIVRVQANAARLNNIQPQTEKLMEKIKRYNKSGNTAMSAQVSAELFSLYKKNGCNPYKMALTPLVQLPLFISFFMALRQMAAVPVESMKTGGLYWFTDLTVPDPYYLLPLMGCGAFIAIIELGGDAGTTNPQLKKLKPALRASSILLLAVTAKFPAGLFMYWLSSSLISMGQISLLKLRSFRSLMGIPDLIIHENIKDDGKGFIATLKSGFNNAALTTAAKDREAKAKKRYGKMKKDPSPKLYDKPPNLR